MSMYLIMLVLCSVSFCTLTTSTASRQWQKAGVYQRTKASCSPSLCLRALHCLTLYFIAAACEHPHPLEMLDCCVKGLSLEAEVEVRQDCDAGHLLVPAAAQCNLLTCSAKHTAGISGCWGGYV